MDCYEWIISKNTKSAEYVVSLACKQKIGLGNCHETEGCSCEDRPVILKSYKKCFSALISSPSVKYLYATVALKSTIFSKFPKVS